MRGSDDVLASLEADHGMGATNTVLCELSQRARAEREDRCGGAESSEARCSGSDCLGARVVGCMAGRDGYMSSFLNSVLRHCSCCLRSDPRFGSAGGSGSARRRPRPDARVVFEDRGRRGRRGSAVFAGRKSVARGLNACVRAAGGMSAGTSSRRKGTGAGAVGGRDSPAGAEAKRSMSTPTAKAQRSVDVRGLVPERTMVCMMT